MTARTRSFIRTIIILPVNVVVLIPAVILWIVGTPFWTPVLDTSSDRISVIVGGVLFLVGVGLGAWTSRAFLRLGEGTPAPWDPPQKLVIAGVYRHVRNPMITGVFCMLLGEALLLRAFPVFVWFMVFVAANFLWIPLVEERGLVRRFGEAYVTYRKFVPRWLPRIRPWRGPAE